MDFNTPMSTSIDHVIKSNETSVAVRKQLISDEVYVGLMFLWSILLLFILPPGLVGNALAIRTFLRMGLDDSITISFFVLALSDFAHLFFPLANIVLQILYYVEATHGAFFQISIRALYAIVVNFAAFLNVLTSLITAFLALQRCLCIVMPFQFKAMVTKSRTWRAMAIFAFFSFGYGAAFQSGYTLTRQQASTNRTQYALYILPHFQYLETYVNTVVFTLVNVGCQLVSFGSLVVMAYSLSASVKFRREFAVTKANPVSCVDREGGRSHVQAKSSKERNAVVQVAILSSIYLVTNMPKLLFALAAAVVDEFKHVGFHHHLFSICGTIRVTSDYINSSVNFLVYYKYNSRFRKMCFNKNYPERDISR